MEPKVKSLVKAMEVLECFTKEQPELGVSDIAHRLGLQKSSVHNILSTFEMMGYVEQNPDTHRYYLGIRLMHFSYIINSHMGLHKAVSPYLKTIAATMNEIAYLGIPSGSDVLYIDSYSTDNRASSRNILGERAPMYCTGLGKAILAYLPESSQLLPEVLSPYTENTITDRDALMRELERIRMQGYAVDNMEHEFGIKCIAVPIFGVDKLLRCAVSVSGPSLRFLDENIPQMAQQMQAILAPAQHKF